MSALTFSNTIITPQSTDCGIVKIPIFKKGDVLKDMISLDDHTIEIGKLTTSLKDVPSHIRRIIINNSIIQQGAHFNEIPEGCVVELNEVTYVIYGNSLDCIPVEIFSKITKLDIYWMILSDESATIDDIFPEICGMANLRSLALACSNGPTVVPEWVYSLTQLTELDLSDVYGWCISEVSST
jgi:hypothetical protein